MEKESCLIMMATYNGAEFIAEQLNSIVNQTYRNWKLLIRDDGSVDETVKIISRYIKNDSRIELLQNTTTEHGAYSNFYALVRESKQIEQYDYYLFADQDDIWLSGKIERMIEEFHKSDEKEKPLLVYGNMKLIDAEGCVIDENVAVDLKTGTIGRNPIIEFFYGCIHGCNMIFNKALFSIVPVIDQHNCGNIEIPHDILYPQFAAIKGTIKFIPDPLMLYRRHDGNVSKKTNYSKGIKWILNKAKFLGKFSERHANYYNISLQVISIIKSIKLSNVERERLLKTEEAIKKGGITAVKFCLNERISTGRKSQTILRYLILLSGSYRKYLITT